VNRLSQHVFVRNAGVLTLFPARWAPTTLFQSPQDELTEEQIAAVLRQSIAAADCW
jgi:hypothetical protein